MAFEIERKVQGQAPQPSSSTELGADVHQAMASSELSAKITKKKNGMYLLEFNAEASSITFVHLHKLPRCHGCLQ